MKKIVRLTESDLARIIKRVIKEQSSVSNPSNSSVIAIYNQIVEAVVGIGTDPDAVLSAIKKLKNLEEFSYLSELFRNKKTGYSNFFEMVNEEYERDNAEDVENLMSALRKINILTGANIVKNFFGGKLFLGGFRFIGVGTTSNMERCKTLWSKASQNAIKWWKDWLSDPITKKKFLSNYSDKPYAVTLYYPKYFELLGKIKLNFYNDSMAKINGVNTHPDAIAYVTEPDGNIYINCSNNPTIEEYEGILIHEIQHMIYDIKPLNPAEKISAVFGKNSPKKSKEEIKKEFISTPSNKAAKFSAEIIAAAKKLNVEPIHIARIKEIYNQTIKRYEHDPGYICRETEKMSNINGIRLLLGVKPGQNITLDMIRPYITRDELLTDFHWLLLCWAEKGFPDINQMLQKINQLALQQNTKSPKNLRA